MMDDSIDVSDSDSSNEENANQRPNEVAYGIDGPESINQTAASYKQGAGLNDGNENFNSAGEMFMRFVSEQLVKEKKKNRDYLENDDQIFGEYKNYMKVYQPTYNLYFLSTTIIFMKKVDLFKLREKISKKYSETANIILMHPPLKPKDEEQILVTIHTAEEKLSYKIRNLLYNPEEKGFKHPHPECLDKDLCLNPLFEFYSKNKIGDIKFDETCGCMLYWAYQKGLLDEGYFDENSLKMIVLYFFLSLGIGLPNVIIPYKDKKEQQLLEIKKMYRVTKDYKCELDPALNKHANFTIKTKKGFYIESLQKYTIIKEIFPIPFPVREQDMAEFISKKRSKQLETLSKKNNPCVIFLNLLTFLSRSMHRSEKIILDFKQRKVGRREASLDFDLEIIHPILNRNMCGEVTANNSKIRKIKHEVQLVVKHMKYARTEHEALKLIFTKN